MREARTFQGVKIPLRCMAGGSFPRAAFGDTNEAGVDRTRGTDGVDRGWRVRGGRPYGTLTFNQRAMEAIRTFPA